MRCSKEMSLLSFFLLIYTKRLLKRYSRSGTNCENSRRRSSAVPKSVTNHSGEGRAEGGQKGDRGEVKTGCR